MNSWKQPFHAYNYLISASSQDIWIDHRGTFKITHFLIVRSTLPAKFKMLLSSDCIKDILVVWPSERTRLSILVSVEGMSMLVFGLSGVQPTTFLDPHPWPLVYCKYCKMHFDIIDMFWYVSHNQWVQLKISYKESVCVFVF